jgi:hypothetical protein
MAYLEDVTEIEKMILSDPKAVYFASDLFGSIKRCTIGSVSLSLQKVILIIQSVSNLKDLTLTKEVRLFMGHC